jgi:hypothetical protein
MKLATIQHTLTQSGLLYTRIKTPSTYKNPKAINVSALLHESYKNVKHKKSLEKKEALILIQEAKASTQKRLSRKSSQRLQNRLKDLEKIESLVQNDTIQIVGFLGWGQHVLDTSIKSKQNVSEYDALVFIKDGRRYVEQLGSSALRHASEGGAIYDPKKNWKRVDDYADEQTLYKKTELKKEIGKETTLDRLNRSRLNITEAVFPDGPPPLNKKLVRLNMERNRDLNWRRYLQWKNIKAGAKSAVYATACATESTTVGLALKGVFHASGILSESAQLKQGILEQKEGKKKGVYVLTATRAATNMTGDILGIVSIIAEKTGAILGTVLGLAFGAQAANIAADSLGIYKLAKDILAANKKIGDLEAIQNIQKLTDDELQDLSFYKKDRLGQYLGIGARLLNIVSNALSITALALGIFGGLAFLTTTPIGWALLSVTFLAGILFWVSSGIRMAARPIPGQL